MARYKTSSAAQAKSLKTAHRNGLPWNEDDISLLVKGIEADETSIDIAIALGRSYYATMGARARVGFAMRYMSIIMGLK